MWSDEARQASADARKGSGVQKDFGKRAHPPGLPAHQSRVAKLVSDFAHSESGEGKVPKALEDFDIRNKGPAELGRIGKEVAAALHEGRLDVSSLIHFAHFLTTLACIAVADVIIQWVIHVV